MSSTLGWATLWCQAECNWCNCDIRVRRKNVNIGPSCRTTVTLFQTCGLEKRSTLMLSSGDSFALSRLFTLPTDFVHQQYDMLLSGGPCKFASGSPPSLAPPLGKEHLVRMARRTWNMRDITERVWWHGRPWCQRWQSWKACMWSSSRKTREA